MKKHILLSIALLSFVFSYAQIQAGLTNDFEDGTTQGWSNGGGSPNPPVNIPDGGPGGAGDNFLEEVSSGAAGPGGKMVIFNENAEWLGNYVAAGILGIDFSIKNGGSEDLFIRIGIEGGPDGSEMVTTNFISVPVSQSDWTGIGFSMDPSEFTVTDGIDTPSQILSQVDQIRILSNENVSYVGAQVAATMHIDNISVSGSFGVEDQLGSSLRLFPNPAGNVLNFSAELPIDAYRIYNILGAAVAEGSVGASTHQLDVASLTSGIYLIEVRSEGQSTTRKFVKK
ncbi:MAG: T9SS type A sorting domain-containing protein [Bacteroidota bacterium]